MKSIRSAVLFLFAAAVSVSAQTSSSDPASVPAVTPPVAAGDARTATKAAVSAAVPAQDSSYVRPDSKARFRRYVNSMFGPMALGKTVLSAGWATWRNSPEEWGDNWEGFGRRLASSAGKNVIKQTTRYGLEEALKYDSRYYRSEKRDFGSRLGNALISPVTARNERGKRVVGIPRIVGTYTSSVVAAEVWYPSRYNYKDGLKNGTVSLGMNAAFNVIKEFVWKK